MQLYSVVSSSILQIGYEPSSLTLRIVFRNGSAYDYHGVPILLAQQFLSAPSKGRFYSKFIKGRFSPFRIQ